MKLIKLKLKNYRCFGDEETVLNVDDMTVLIGNNSSGKTAVLSALNSLLNSRTVSKSDFHVPPGVTLQQLARQELYIEAVFSFPELAEDDDSSPAIAPLTLSGLINLLRQSLSPTPNYLKHCD